MRYLLLALLTLAAVTAFGQGRERAVVQYLHEGSGDLEGGGDLTLREMELRTGLPPIRNGNRMLNLGLRWTVYDFQAEDSGLDDFTAHSIRLPIRGSLSHSNAWSWSALLTPALRTDFEHLTTDDLGINGLFLGTYPWRPTVNLTAGLVYGQTFGRSQFFPALGATWTPDPAWSLELLFPRPRVVYTPAPQVSFNLALEPGGDEWNIDLEGQSRDLALEEYRAGAGAEWRLAQHLAVTLQSGYVFSRDLEVRDGRRKEWERAVGDSWFARIGLLYR